MSIGAQPATRFKCLVQANGTAMGVDLRLNYVLDFRNQGAYRIDNGLLRDGAERLTATIHQVSCNESRDNGCIEDCFSRRTVCFDLSVCAHTRQGSSHSLCL